MSVVKYSVAVLMLVQIASATLALAGKVVQIKIDDLAFSPAEITVKAGDTIEWVNVDFIDHTATENSGAWDVMIITEQSARLQLSTAGTFDYYCRIHPGMTGKIHVIAP